MASRRGGRSNDADGNVEENTEEVRSFDLAGGGEGKNLAVGAYNQIFGLRFTARKKDW
jgi:hypothetical protein